MAVAQNIVGGSIFPPMQDSAEVENVRVDGNHLVLTLVDGKEFRANLASTAPAPPSSDAGNLLSTGSDGRYFLKKEDVTQYTRVTFGSTNAAVGERVKMMSAGSMLLPSAPASADEVLVTAFGGVVMVAPAGGTTINGGNPNFKISTGETWLFVLGAGADWKCVHWGGKAAGFMSLPTAP
ncbi:hypothetical protein [Thalassobius sp. Cn5-15]|uniref:hypothetical protein n=1 Tax=Thalassobius sp. Cn5-15 TaxID=2917763 RepID=UPI001EF2C052|nr:hypothetical protein [Thalassobius sp. Cn5-15]MCG7492481.1 hypothetical protein [Thalassobius sp. Cn5-15]